MKLVPVLNFDGNCSEAVAFYTKVFDAKEVKIQTYGDNIEYFKKEHIEISSKWEDKIMHASITLPDDASHIFLHDKMENGVFHSGGDTVIALEFATQEELDQIYHRLKEGGTIETPIQKMFWHAMYAVVIDKFKRRWVLNCQIVSID